MVNANLSSDYLASPQGPSISSSQNGVYEVTQPLPKDSTYKRVPSDLFEQFQMARSQGIVHIEDSYHMLGRKKA